LVVVDDYQNREGASAELIEGFKGQSTGLRTIPNHSNCAWTTS
jgi:hypothetical protein